jgi:hypothetical protein
MDSPVVESKSEGVFFLVGTYYGERLFSTSYDNEDTVTRLQAADKTSAANIFGRIREKEERRPTLSPWKWVEITSNTYCYCQALVI